MTEIRKKDHLISTLVQALSEAIGSNVKERIEIRMLAKSNEHFSRMKKILEENSPQNIDEIWAYFLKLTPDIEDFRFIPENSYLQTFAGNWPHSEGRCVKCWSKCFDWAGFKWCYTICVEIDC